MMVEGMAEGNERDGSMSDMVDALVATAGALLDTADILAQLVGVERAPSILDRIERRLMELERRQQTLPQPAPYMPAAPSPGPTPRRERARQWFGPDISLTWTATTQPSMARSLSNLHQGLAMLRGQLGSYGESTS